MRPDGTVWAWWIFKDAIKNGPAARQWHGRIRSFAKFLQDRLPYDEELFKLVNEERVERYTRRRAEHSLYGAPSSGMTRFLADTLWISPAWLWMPPSAEPPDVHPAMLTVLTQLQGPDLRGFLVGYELLLAEARNNMLPKLPRMWSPRS